MHARCVGGCGRLAADIGLVYMRILMIVNWISWPSVHLASLQFYGLGRIAIVVFFGRIVVVTDVARWYDLSVVICSWV